MSRLKPYTSKDVTKHLRLMAAEVHKFLVDDDGEGRALTRGEALALMLWERALGYEDVSIDDEGIETKVKHEPASWAIQLVYDRMEGKIPIAITEDEDRVTTADKVGDLAKNRISDLAVASVKKVDSVGVPPIPSRRKKPDA